MENYIQLRVEKDTKCIFAIVGKWCDDIYETYFFDEDTHQSATKEYILTKTKPLKDIDTKTFIDRLEYRGYLNIKIVNNLRLIDVLN